MADFNPSSSSAPPANGFQLESDDFSTLLHTLFQSSALPSSSASLNTSQHHHQGPPVEVEGQLCGSVVLSESSSALDLSFRSDDCERSRSAFSGAIALSADEICEFDCESEKGQNVSEMQRNSGPRRSSSKRTRTAEIHNLSEKRRRQRINERLKALQKLIPNSNKTDKASMLDEAIEYLKQLQLQVQMLALRNGSALHPYYIPGVMHSAQPTATGICFNVGDGLASSSSGIGSLPANQEMPVQTVFNASSRCASSDQKMFLPMAMETGNSEYSFAQEPSTSNHCKPFNFVMPPKDLYGDKLSQLQLDMSRCGDESSSGVSS